MIRVNRDGLYSEKGYRIRCMRSLLEQLKNDYADCNRLWHKLEKGTADSSQVEDLLRVLSWLKEGLNVFNDLGKQGIEVVSWGDLKYIVNGVKHKEMLLRIHAVGGFSSQSRSL